MDKMLYLYTSFNGRLNRQPFWLASIGLFLLALVLSVVVILPLASISAQLGKAVNFVLSVAILYPVCALGVKRLKDRNKPLWLMAVFIAPSLLFQVLDLLGLATQSVSIQGQAIAAPTLLGSAIGLIGLIVGIWGLITLGFKKGTTGPNPYGPDPLATIHTENNA